jgi:hypothetical protein
MAEEGRPKKKEGKEDMAATGPGAIGKLSGANVSTRQEP